MKKIKIALVFSVLSMISISESFAQEKTKLSKKEIAHQQKQIEVSSEKAKEQIVLLEEKLSEATPEQRIEIKKKINVLKKGNNSVSEEITQKSNTLEDNEAFIQKGKLKIQAAKDRVQKALNNGEINEEEAEMKKIKIAEVERKLKLHEMKVKEAVKANSNK